MSKKIFSNVTSHSLSLLFTLTVIIAISTNAQASIFDKARPDYDAKNIRAGSFIIVPNLLIKQSHDDNIYSSQTNESGDFINEIKPGAEIKSDWNRHQLSFNADGDFFLYHDKTDENHNDYNVGTSGRLDILKKTSIKGSANFAQKHEDRGSPDSISTAVEPTQYNESNFNIGFERSLRKISFKIDEDIKIYDYKNGHTSSNSVLDNSGRDRKEYIASSRLSYEFIPSHNIFIQGSYNNRNYSEKPTLDRSSQGFKASIGTSLNISKKIKGEVFAGYMQQEYEVATLSTVNGATFGGDLSWDPTNLTFLRFSVSRSIEETTIGNFAGYISTFYNAAIEHELLRNLLLGADFSFAKSQYRGKNIADRVDDNITAKAKIKYLINRNLSININYQHTNNNTEAVGQDYEKNIVGIGLNISL